MRAPAKLLRNVNLGAAAAAAGFKRRTQAVVRNAWRQVMNMV